MNGLIFTTPPVTANCERSAGSYRIAHHLRKRLSIDVEVVDYLVYWYDDELIELIKSRIIQNNIVWIGMSVTWVDNYETFLRFNELVRKYFPQLKIIVGGQDIYYKYIKADYYINGYGELACEAALKHAFSDGKISGMPINKGWLIDALHLYPSYPPEMVDNSYEIIYEKRDFLTPNESVVIEFQRGCKFACKYCSYPLLNVKGDTSRSIEDISTELKRNYYDWGLTSYNIADETINNSTEKLVKISKAVSGLDFTPNFTGCVRLDLLPANPEQLDLLIQSRIWGHFYGIETFNHETGKIIGKGLDPEKNKRALLDVREKVFKSIGAYRGTVSMISGLPRESYESMHNSSKWLKENWIDQSILWFGLSITRKQNPIDGSLKLSAFGEDLSKFGYSDMDDFLDPVSVHKPYGAYPHSVNWKNEHGTYLDAQEFALHNNGLAVGSNLNNYDLWSLASVVDVPILELWKTDKNYIDYFTKTKRKRNREKHILSYIKNKLDLY